MKHLVLILLFISSLKAFSQSTFAPLNEDYYHRIDRYEIKAGQIIPEIFTSVKPYKRSAIVAYIDSVNQLNVFTSQADKFNFELPAINISSILLFADGSTVPFFTLRVEVTIHRKKTDD